MTRKKILSVGFELADDDIQYCPFNSNISLLDWDIILFRPVIDDFLTQAEVYKGKLALRDFDSFRLIPFMAIFILHNSEQPHA
jgi:hypothetical protein